MSVWLRYVDDTFTVLNEEEIENIKILLNNFHPNIKFTHEVEVDNSISFLDVKVTRDIDNNFSTCVYRKQTDTSIYVHWRAHAPKTWKLGTLKGLFRRAFLVSSSDTNLKNEIDYLKNIFIKINKYPIIVVKNTLKLVKNKISKERAALAVDGNAPATMDLVTSVTDDDAPSTTHPHIILPYKGYKGENIIKNLKKLLSSSLPKHVIPRYIYKGRKLGSFFPIKDKVTDIHKSDLVYGYRIPDTRTDSYDYIGESKVRHETRIYEHSYTDKNSSIYKHSQDNNYVASPSNFCILASGYDSWIDRRLCEALFVRDYKPTLNVQKNSHKLELFS